MNLRVNIEFLIVIVYSLIFLDLIIIFVGDLHKAEHEAQLLLDIRNEYYGTTDAAHGYDAGHAGDANHRNLAGGGDNLDFS